MKWQDLKSVIVEANDRVIIAVEFQSGKKITIRNVPKALTLKPDFNTVVAKKAKTAEPNETFSGWVEVSTGQADAIDAKAPKNNPGDKVTATSGVISLDDYVQLVKDNEWEKVHDALTKNPELIDAWGIGYATQARIASLAGKPGPKYKPDEEEKLDMENCQSLFKLINKTFDNSVYKGLTYADNRKEEDIFYNKRSQDPEFPGGVSFEWKSSPGLRPGGRIDDIKTTFNITAMINTNTPKLIKTDSGYQWYESHEGFPSSVGDWDRLKEMIVKEVFAEDTITTTGPAQQDQKLGEPLKVTIGARGFTYINSIVPDGAN